MAHILVCDDAHDLRLVMQITLESAGHTVTDAAGGLHVLAMLDQLEEVDAVVLDVQMPGVDGWSVLRAIRTHPVHRDVPVLMCTVKFGHADLVRAWEMECDGYLNKPFDLSDLTGAISNLISADLPTRVARRHAELLALTSTAP